MALKGILKQSALNIFPPSGDLSMGGFKLTDLGNPTLPQDAATKSYVDAFVSGLTPLTACRVATTTALTVTYSNGTAGVGATLTNASTQAAIAIDGVTLALNDRVLVKNQSSTFQNGVYTATTLGDGSHNWVLTRATDFNSSSNILEGSFTNITAGSVNIGEVWLETGSGPFTIGTTPIVFTLFSILGTMATQNSNAVAITGGTITGTTVSGLTVSTTTGTLTLANNFITSGNFSLTLTQTSATNVTLPTTGTLTTLATVLATANTWGATQTYADNIITGPELKDFSETTQSVAAATTTTVDYTLGGIILLSQDTAITTFNITNPSPTGKACSLTFIRTKDATGTARLITWPSGTIWAGGATPTLSTTTGAVDIITLLTVNAGTTWYGFVGGQAFA